MLSVLDSSPRLPRLLVALLALLLASNCSGSVLPAFRSQQQHRELRVFGLDDRVQVPSAASSPYSAVGLLRWNAKTLCTASLVADSVIVTAAECVLDTNGAVLTTDADQKPVFFPGVVNSPLSSLNQSPKALVTAMHKQSDYWVKWTRETYVLLELDTALGATVGTLGLSVLGELDPQLTKTPVQMVGFRVDDAAASMTYQSCTCRLPLEFDGAPYLVHHDCDAAPSGSPGSPLLVNYSSTETYMVGIHSNAIGRSSDLTDATYATYNDAVANRGVLAPYIQQHLTHLTARAASGSGSVSMNLTTSQPTTYPSSGEGPEMPGSSNSDQGPASAASASSSASSQATQSDSPSSSSRSSLDPAIAVTCIGLVAVAWACVVFIATRRYRRRAQPPESLIDGEQ